MIVKEKKSIILFPIVVLLAWIYWGVIEFAFSIPTEEQSLQPEIPHPKGMREYIGEAPFYILLFRDAKGTLKNYSQLSKQKP